MSSRQGFIRWTLAVAGLVLVAATTGSAWGAPAQTRAFGHEFVVRTGPELRLHGKTFHFAGTNNYYLPYSSRLMVDDVLTTAAAQGFDVVRTWGFMEQAKNGVQFQSWNAATGAPAFNDGPTGLEHLDYVIAKAGQLGLRLVIPFTNNWGDFGGMDQYVNWRADSTGSTGPRFHDSFYTDPVIRQWYKAYVDHLLNRVNTITGVRYRDDPTIMTWELGNEPRCLGGLPASPSCTTKTLLDWADEMSSFVKGIDKNHLVSVGDEGFYCVSPSDPDWTRNCGEGVDTVAFAKLKSIDVMSFHLYPDSWGKTATPQWAVDWITSHFAAARGVGKPAMLGEFGLKDDSGTRNPVYKTWLDAVVRSNGAGALYWILSGHQDDGSLYPDYDGFTVYCPSPVCTTISNFAQEQHAGRELVFPPVADDDRATTAFETPVTLNAAANDIAYGGASIVTGSLDLDAATAGRQASATVAGGTFTSNGDGTVTFAPASGFSGKATATYVISDSAQRLSNAATLSVAVKPNPTGTLLLASYESGLDGATTLSWGGTGSVSQTTAYASDGSHSLQVDDATEGWFQIAQLSPPADLTGKSVLEVDLHTTTQQTFRKISIQTGSGWVWCEGNGGNTPAGTTDTVSVDLTSCSGADLTQLQVVNMYLQPGTFYVDNVRAQ
jgi:mannan endo-1,4-beta-mannosidase